ncbi:MAG TPA: type II/IV secretion system protein [Candidatus Saccharimonadales bacterium]|nr:type II/IV secretion system protein [Candidatus Saccharimonadales bacterium]
MGIDDTQLQKILSELDYVPADDLKKAQATVKADNISLYDALLKNDLMSDQDLGKAVAYSLQLPFADLSQSNITEEVLKLVPETVATKYKIITFAYGPDKVLKIATANHTLVDVFEMLAKKTGAGTYRVFFATDRGIEDALRLYRKDLSVAFENLLATNTGKAGAEVPVAKVVDTLIEYAYVSKASDMHIEPTRAKSLVRFRIDGVLHDMVDLPRALHDQVITRIKVMSRLRTDEHFSAQDGRMRVNLSEESIDVRVSVVPVMAGEKVVLRLLASHNRQYGLTDLGMQPNDLAKVKNGFTRPHGMVLSTGPTGSGKTTSMYAILKILNTREKNIATIEDPVEYEVEGINQIQANPKTNLTFAAGLRSLLRQDPDIMYVGEIRDEETADIAINSALTGHLVLSTMHTNDAATALPRLIDMKIEPFLVASTVNVIVAQRLVRKICDRCKVSFELTRDKTGWKGADEKTLAILTNVNDRLITKYFGTSGSMRTYRGKGCPVCHQTGYRGRVGIFEVLEVDPVIQQLIVSKASSEAITKQAMANGMTSMMDDGFAKVQQGLTTIEEVVRVTRE